MLLLQLKNAIGWILILERRDTPREHYRYFYHILWTLKSMHENVHGILVNLFWYLVILSVYPLIAIVTLKFEFHIRRTLYWWKMIYYGIVILVRSKVLIIYVLLAWVNIILLTNFYILFLKLTLVFIYLLHILRMSKLIKISLYWCKINRYLFFLKFPASVRSIFQNKIILLIITSIHRRKILDLICILNWILKLFQCIWMILNFIWLKKFHKSIICHIFLNSNSFPLLFNCIIIQKVLFIKSFLLNWSS